MPELNGSWHRFTVVIERSRLEGNFKLSINGEDSPDGKTFRMGLDAEQAILNLARLVTRMKSGQLK